MSKLLICFIALNFLHAKVSADESSADVALPSPPYCGGQSADVNNLPWLVYILHRPIFSTDDTRCAGTLLNSRWVLTPAHCVTGFEKFVELGDRSTARVDKKILHPEFNENDKVWKSDIALLRLASPLNYTQEIQPICLPLNKNVADVQKDVEIVSWSHPSDSSRSKSDTKKVTSFSVLSTEFCEKELGNKNIPFEATHHLCASGKECLENSGEILQLKKDEVYYQIGLLTHVTENCTPQVSISSIFNRIDAFVSWIAETISANK